MSTLRVTNVQDTAGANSLTTAQIYNGAAKAWVNFNGTFATSPFNIANGGIRASFNVSSITDNGTGNYTVNFTTAMADANYCWLGTVRRNTTNSDSSGGVAQNYNNSTVTTSALQVFCRDINDTSTGLADPLAYHVAVFR